MQHDRCRPGVADAGGFAGFLDSVVVVAGAFHCSWAGAFGAVGDEQLANLADFRFELDPNCLCALLGSVGTNQRLYLLLGLASMSDFLLLQT